MFYDLKVTYGNLEFYHHEDFYEATYVTILGDYCCPYSMDKSFIHPRDNIFLSQLTLRTLACHATVNCFTLTNLFEKNGSYRFNLNPM